MLSLNTENKVRPFVFASKTPRLSIKPFRKSRQFDDNEFNFPDGLFVLDGWIKKFMEKISFMKPPFFVYDKIDKLEEFLSYLEFKSMRENNDMYYVVYVLTGKDISIYRSVVSDKVFVVFLPSFATIIPYNRKSVGTYRLHIEVAIPILKNIFARYRLLKNLKSLKPYPIFKMIGNVVLQNYGIPIKKIPTIYLYEDKFDEFENDIKNAESITIDIETEFPHPIHNFDRLLSLISLNDVIPELDFRKDKVSPKVMPITEIGILVKGKTPDKYKLYYISVNGNYELLTDLWNDDGLYKKYEPICKVVDILVKNWKDKLVIGHNVKFDIVKLFQMYELYHKRILKSYEVYDLMPDKIYDTLIARVSENTVSSPNALKRLAGIMGYPDYGVWISLKPFDILKQIISVIERKKGMKNLARFLNFGNKDYKPKFRYVYADLFYFIVDMTNKYIERRLGIRTKNIEKELFNNKVLPDPYYVASVVDKSKSIYELKVYFEEIYDINLNEIATQAKEKSLWYFLNILFDYLTLYDRSWADYNLSDVIITYELYEKQMQTSTGKNYYKRLLSEIYPFLIFMETVGIGFDVEEWKKRRELLLSRLRKLTPQYFDLPSDLPSPTQSVKISAFLKEFGLKNNISFLKEINSSNKAVLEEIIEKSEEWGKEGDFLRRYVEYVLLHRLLSKQSLMYSLSWIGRYVVFTVEGPKIYPTFNVDGTATGRLSSSEPNMQNLPSDRALFQAEKHFPELIKTFKVKELLKSKYGGYIGEVDFSQAEVRVMVIFSKDENMYRAYEEGKDVYRVNASIVLEKPEEEITDEERQFFKQITLGTMYGAGVGRLISLGVPPDKAVEVRKKFYEAFPSLQEYRKWALDLFKSDLKSYGMFRIKDLKSLISEDVLEIPEFKEVIDREYSATINMPIQSTSSDLTVLAAMMFQEFLFSLELKSHVVNMVHDSVVVDIHPDEVDTIKEIVKHFFSKNLYRDLIYKFYDYITDPVKKIIDLSKICPSKADLTIYGLDNESD